MLCSATVATEPSDTAPSELQAAEARALQALEDLVVATVRAGGGRSRFARAGRICEMGQQLQRATAQRVEDFREDDRLPRGRRILGNFVGGGDVDEPELAVPMGLQPALPGGNMTRSMLGALMPALEAQGRAHEAQAAGGEARGDAGDGAVEEAGLHRAAPREMEMAGRETRLRFSSRRARSV